MNIFHVNHFFPVLHQTQCSNFRVTEILVVLSGDFCRYLSFSVLSGHKLLDFNKWEVIILWICRICFWIIYLFFPVLDQTLYSNFRVTEILVVLSGDFCRYLAFSVFSGHKILDFNKWEVIILWLCRICYAYNMLRNKLYYSVCILGNFIRFFPITQNSELPNKMDFRFKFYIEQCMK